LCIFAPSLASLAAPQLTATHGRVGTRRHPLSGATNRLGQAQQGQRPAWGLVDAWMDGCPARAITPAPASTARPASLTCAISETRFQSGWLPLSKKDCVEASGPRDPPYAWRRGRPDEGYLTYCQIEIPCCPTLGGERQTVAHAQTRLARYPIRAVASSPRQAPIDSFDFFFGA
jgi:hypothetical protein